MDQPPSPLTFDFYETQAASTAIYNHDLLENGFGLPIYPALKLCGEAGEVAEKIGKIIRDQNGRPTIEDSEKIIKELGDVLWYINAIAVDLGFTLEDVALTNLTKLQGRQARGKIQGSGDDR